MKQMQVALALVVATRLGAAMAVAEPAPEAPLLPGLDVPYRTQLVREWPTDLTGSPVSSSHASLTPDGGRICYEFERPVMMGPSIGIRLWDVANSIGLVEELVTGFRNPHDPALSPDGRTLLFISKREDAPEEENAAIWAIDLPGSAPRRITSPGVFRPNSPAWRPDGSTIVFVKRVPKGPAEPGAGFDETLAFIDVTQPQTIAREVTVTSGLVEPPLVGGLRYSPDGRWITCGISGWGDLGVIDPETGRLYTLFDASFTTLSFSRKTHTAPSGWAWLPDSQRLLITVRGGDDLTGPLWRIWMVNLAGEARQLGEGRVLGGPVHARILFIYKDGQVYRVDFE